MQEIFCYWIWMHCFPKEVSNSWCKVADICLTFWMKYKHFDQVCKKILLCLCLACSKSPISQWQSIKRTNQKVVGLTPIESNGSSLSSEYACVFHRTTSSFTKTPGLTFTICIEIITTKMLISQIGNA